MSDEFGRGLYETLLSEGVSGRLSQVDQRLEAAVVPLHRDEAADRLALHLSRLVEQSLAGVPDAERVEVGIRLVRALIDQIDATVDRSDLAGDRPTDPGTVLAAILGRKPDGSLESIQAPRIPLLDTTLLTNAPGEPRVGAQIRAEIESADRIDVVMAFIRRSGMRPLLDDLRRHVASADDPTALRVLTTTYTGSTERKALDDLRDLGADVRVSYDTSTTRLHAKAWLFHRRSGYSTAYIGSSNLTYSAQVDGLEWNVRMSGARNPDVLRKMTSVFDGGTRGGAGQHPLGGAQPVDRQGRERPMAITWRLDHPLPGDLYASFAAAVA